VMQRGVIVVTGGALKKRHEGHQVDFAGRVFPGDHRRADARTTTQRHLDLSEFVAQAADLHLDVHPAGGLQVAMPQPAG
jgi:hypothetical protein